MYDRQIDEVADLKRSYKRLKKARLIMAAPDQYWPGSTTPDRIPGSGCAKMLLRKQASMHWKVHGQNGRE